MIKVIVGGCIASIGIAAITIGCIRQADIIVWFNTIMQTISL